MALGQSLSGGKHLSEDFKEGHLGQQLRERSRLWGPGVGNNRDVRAGAQILARVGVEAVVGLDFYILGDKSSGELRRSQTLRLSGASQEAKI